MSFEVFMGVAMAVLAALAGLFSSRSKKAKAAQRKLEESKVGTQWRDQTPPAVVTAVVEKRVEAEATATAQQKELEQQAKATGTSATAAAGALHDAFNDLKK